MAELRLIAMAVLLGALLAEAGWYAVALGLAVVLLSASFVLDWRRRRRIYGGPRGGARIHE